ncbi:Subtilase family [Popillia japonica]|uniref:Subtilase family n=1 Tax=Popillia japonica TaxID=7064 RepID=A0AAW1LW28_POPJA
MSACRSFVIILLSLLVSLTEVLLSRNVYDNEIVIRILGGSEVAQLLAMEMGYTYRGHVHGFPDTYLLTPQEEEYPSHKKRGLDLTKRLTKDARVLWADPQEVKQRQKRDFREDLLSELPLFRVKRMSDESKFLKKPFRPKLNRLFNDELWTQEWYLQDTRTRPDLPKLDLNVLPVYKAGITGKGVRVSILDDGIEHIHDDLKDNYDPDISWDCNEDDSDPLPRYEPTRQNSHGTRCAGEVAEIRTNETK